MVFVTGIPQNINHMFGGLDNASWMGFPLFVLAMIIMTIGWLWLSPSLSGTAAWCSVPAHS